MNASITTPAMTQPLPAALAKGAQPHTHSVGLRLNAHAGIFFLSTMLTIATASECQSATHLSSLFYGAVLWFWWGCIASVMWGFGEHVPFVSGIPWQAAATHLALGSGLGVLHILLLSSFGFMTPDWREHATALQIWTRLFNINRFGIEVLLYGFVLGITGVIRYQIRAQRDALKSAELQKQLSAAHLRALQMQMEPHFLFNTLNAITTLVELGRQKEAAEMLSHLNALLKTTLQRNTPEKIPLSQELEMMENYLAIEQVRFADRLRIEIKVEPGALDGLVPCFLLQPIVENAIRHGIAKCENSGTVEASARRDGATLRLLVRDSGPGIQTASPNGHGIGLRNIRERLAHFYQDDYVMQAQPAKNGGFEVAIAIPYEHCSR